MNTKIRAALAAALLSCVYATSALATGAIAVNDEQGMAADEAGYAVGYGSTKKEAEKHAVKECKAAGNDTCKVAVWFEQCGAYAGDRVNYGIGYGATQKAAESMALKDCPNCKIVVSDCQ
jgi:hypothetical protein